MKVILESTTKLVELNGRRCRIWEGKTGNGIRCHAFIQLIAADRGDDNSEFQADLLEHKAPSADVDKAYDLRFFVD